MKRTKGICAACGLAALLALGACAEREEEELSAATKGDGGEQTIFGERNELDVKRDGLFSPVRNEGVVDNRGAVGGSAAAEQRTG